MNRPTIYVVSDSAGAADWLRAILAAGGSAVDARAVQNLAAVPPDASLVVVDRFGTGFRFAPGALKFTPATILAVGALPGVPVAAAGPDGLGCADGMLGSIVPLWHTEWYLALRKALAGGRIGAVHAINLSCGASTRDSLGDPESPVCRAILIPTGLGAGSAIEWTGGSLDSAGFTGDGVIGGTGTTLSLRTSGPGAPTAATIEGTLGTASIELRETTARVTISTAEGQAVLFDGPFDPLAGAARQVAVSALAGRPRMMPGVAGDAFRKSIDGLARACGMTPGSGTGGSFEPNSFRGRDGAGSEVKVFVEGRCNMSCPFCFSPTATPPADTVDGFSRHFEALKGLGVTSVILSGGEPTINRDLAGIVRAARQAGIDDVTLETNAVLVDECLASELAGAGLRRALVSLHSLDPAVSAAMTGVQGLLPRTMAGIQHLLNTGVRVNVNFVITALNWRDLPATARWVSRLVPRPEMMIISSMAATGDAAGRPDLLAKISDAVPAIRQAALLLRDAGVTPVVPGQCGLPPCILPDMPGIFSTEVITSEDPDWVACDMEGRFHAPGCESCRARRSCYGIWKAYAERFGTDEFKPLE